MTDRAFEVLSDRLFRFSLRIMRLCDRLYKKPGVSRMITRQVFDSGTSIGSNQEEGQAAQSKADFISKNSIALKEARETHYWLRLVREGELMPRELMNEIIQEAEEIKKILGAIVSRSKKK